MVKNLPAMQETWVWSLGWEDPLEKGMATHSSILAWRIPRTEEHGRLQSVGLQRVGHYWDFHTHTYTQFWRPEVWNQFHWTKIKVTFLVEARGEILFSCLFQLLEAPYILWLLATSLLPLASISFLTLIRNLIITLGKSRISQIISPWQSS